MSRPSSLPVRFSGVLLLLAAQAGADHLVIDDPANLRADAIVQWSDFSTVHNTEIPDLHGFTPSDGGIPVKPWGTPDSTVTIFNDPGHGLSTPGVLLANSGPSPLHVYFDRPIQGFGFVLEHLHNAGATCWVHFFAYGTGQYLYTVQRSVADGGPVFLGAVDPAARIGVVGVYTAPLNPGEAAENSFVIDNPRFTLPSGDPEGLGLPVAATFMADVSTTHTYLHLGLRPPRPVPATEQATLDNDNAFDLLELFPGLRGGDYIRFGRRGLSLIPGTTQMNPVLGVFTQTEVIHDGSTLRRLPAPLPAGRGYYTRETTEGPFPTPTNIPEDFAIGESTLVAVPANARYLMLSLAQPSLSATPVKVEIDHIPRQPFLDWVASYGLHGANADPSRDVGGLSLLEAYAFGKDPLRPDLQAGDFAFSPRVSPRGGPGRLNLTFGGRLNAGLRYAGEFSSDLLHWDRAEGTNVFPILIDGERNRALFEAIDPNPGNGSRRFGRIVIEDASLPAEP